MVETWVVHQKIDFTVYGQIPTYFTSEMKNEVVLEPDLMKQRYVFLRENAVESEEGWLQFGQMDSYKFYDVGRINSRDMDITYYNTMPKAKDSVFQAIVFRDN